MIRRTCQEPLAHLPFCLIRALPIVLVCWLCIFTASTAHSDEKLAFNHALPITGRLIFTATVNGDQRIMAADMATGKLTTLINGPKEDWYGVLHPSGSEIIFVSDRDGGPSLYRADWDGGRIERVTTGGPVGDPDWHHDKGKRIVYYYREEGGPERTNIFSYDLKTKKESRITKFSGRISTPKISPNGQQLAYSTNEFWPGWDVCLFDFRSKSSNCPLKGLESYCRPSWSNQGEFLLYSVGVTDSIALGGYILQSNRKAIQLVLTGKIYDAIFIEKNNVIFSNNQSGTFDLYFRTATETFPLIESPYDLRYPSWHPNSLMQQEIQRLKASQKP